MRYQTALFTEHVFCLEARCQRLTVISSQIFQDDLNKWSVKRDSNPRPSGPKPDALPNCAIHRTCIFCLEVSLSEGHPLVRYTQEPGCATKLRYSPSMLFCLDVSLTEGHPLVRYSQEPGCAIKLRYSPSMYFCLEARYQRLTVISSQIFQDDLNKWSVKRDSNPRPSGPKPDALPNCAIHRTCIFCLEVSLSEGHPLVRYSQEPGCATKLRYSPSMCFLS